MTKKIELLLKDHKKGFQVFFIIAALLYCNTLLNGFTVDDATVISENTVVQRGITAIGEILTTNYRHGVSQFNDGLYRPLSLITFALEVEFFGVNPFVHHFFNLLYFALSAGLLFWVMRLSFPNKLWFCTVTTLLFIAHPLHTDSIGGVKGRDDILSFLFFISSVYYWLRFLESKSERGALISLGLFVLALLSKESSLTFSLAIPFWLYMTNPAKKKTILKITGVLLITSLIFIAYHENVIDNMPRSFDRGIHSALNNSTVASPIWAKQLSTKLEVLGWSTLKTIWPHPLSYDYSFSAIPVSRFNNGIVWGTLILLLGLPFILYHAFKREKPIFFGLVFFALTYSLTSNLIIPIGVTLAERLLFVPVLGVCLIVGWLLTSSTMTTTISNTFKRVTFLLIFFSYSYVTFSRNFDWESNLTLFTADLHKYESSARINYNYGTEIMKQAHLVDEPEKTKLNREAKLYLIKSIEIWPRYTDALNHLGLVSLSLSENEEALKYYHRLIKYRADWYLPFDMLGRTYYNLKDYKNSLKYFELFNEKNVPNYVSWFMQAKAHGSLGEFDLAIEDLERSLKMQPNQGHVYINLGQAYGIKGDQQKALESFQRGVVISPENDDLEFNIGLTLALMGRFEEAIPHYERAIVLNPENQRARNLLNDAQTKMNVAQ